MHENLSISANSKPKLKIFRWLFSLFRIGSFGKTRLKLKISCKCTFKATEIFLHNNFESASAFGDPQGTGEHDAKIFEF
jgi:hypothetical protein